MSDVKKIYKFLKSFAYGFLLSILILEILIRVFLPQKIEPSLFVSKFGTIVNQHKANIHEKLTYENIPYHLEIDEHNLRNLKTIPYQRSKNTFRILSIGDSMFKGPGLEIEEIFTYYLDQFLNKQKSKIKYEVVNAAMGGANLLDYTLFLQNEGYKYSPDLISLAWSNYDFGLRDLDYISFKTIQAEKVNSKEIQIALKGFKINVPKSFLNTLMLNLSQIPFYTELSKVSHLLNLIRLKSNLLFLKKEEKPLFNLDQFLKGKNVLKKDEKIKDYKIKWLFKDQQIYASQYRSEPLVSAFFLEIIALLLEEVDKIGANLVILDIPDDQEVLGTPTDTTFRKFPKKEKVYLLDLLDTMRPFTTKNPFPLMFQTDPHWTPAGHKLAASITYNFLLENQLIPKEDSSRKNKIDLNNEEIIQKIRLSNKRILKYKDWSQYLLYLKANSLKNQGQLDEAILNYEKYLEVSHNDLYAHYVLGSIYLKKKQFEKAKKQLLIGSESKKSFGLKSLFKLGQTYNELNQHSKAIQTFKNLLSKIQEKKVLELYKVYNALGLSYRNIKNFDNAESSFKKAIKLAPKNSSYLLNIGNLYFDNKKFRKAISIYKKFITFNPQNHKVLTIIGLAYIQLKELKNAKNIFSQVLQIQPDNKMAQMILNQISLQGIQ